MTTHYILYETTNNVNNKIYIGVHKTENLDDGYLGSGNALKVAIEKYGQKNFSRVILGHYPDYDTLLEAEAAMVTKEFVELDTNYNLKTGGVGGIPSRETKDKISNSLIGHGFSDETLKKMSSAKKGKTVSAETRAKIIKNLTGRQVSTTTRKKLSLINPGKRMSKASNEKLSVSLSGRTLSAKHIANRTKSQRGLNRSAETKKKISNGMKNLQKKTCPHCGEHVKPVTYNRWHGDRCKLATTLVAPSS